MKTPSEILKKYWNFSSFKPLQEEIISSVLENNDTIALLPTGGGKSICFQVPALTKDGVCIVISPLIALMQDQINNLKKKGIKATSIPSGSSQDEIITLFDNIRYGNYRFLYLSPERLLSRFIQEKIKQLNVSLITIDEAHCISEWGHDFRPSYRNITILREIHSKTPIIALTATATYKVLNDIIDVLNLKNVKTFKKSFFKENLAYRIYHTEDKLYRLTQLFTTFKAPAIVYVNTRNKTKEIATFLNVNGFKSGYYHGGLSVVEKETTLNHWMTEQTPIIVATNAFGMGIDKPNVKLVVHLNLPNSIENYIQEAGRAGRNGNKAFSVVLTNKSDIYFAKNLIKKTYPTINEIKVIHKKLYQFFQIAKGELIESSFSFNLLEFCNKYNFIPNKTYNALQIMNNTGIIILNANGKQKSTIQFLTNSHTILNYISKNNDSKKIISTLLRIYGGVFEQAVKIDEFYIAKKASTTSVKVIEVLRNLEHNNLVNYHKNDNHSELFFLLPREDDRTINRIQKNIHSYLNQKHKKSEELIHFIENNKTCRSSQLLNYFGESSSKKCGICDVCSQDKNSTKDISEKIIRTIAQFQEVDSKELCKQINSKEQEVLIHLRNLLSEEKIGLNNYNKYYLK